jgi:hypothetical protein
MPNYIFSTPYVEEGPTGEHRLFYFYKLRRGLSVVKSGGSYYTTRYPTEDVINAAQEFYSGGHKYEVTAAVKAALIAGGIGVTEANFTAI